MSRPTLGPTQPPIQCVPGALPWGKTAGAWKLTTHLNPLPRMVDLYLHSFICLHGLAHMDNFSFTFRHICVYHIIRRHNSQNSVCPSVRLDFFLPNGGSYWRLIFLLEAWQGENCKILLLHASARFESITSPLFPPSGRDDYGHVTMVTKRVLKAAEATDMSPRS
jgi:hypothetical protein